MELVGRTHINRPVGDVFALWSNLERTPEYSAPTIERRKLSSGPIGVGTTYHAVDRWPGRTVSFTVEVTEFEPPRRMAARWSEAMRGGWDVVFESEAGGTDVVFTTVMEPSGVLGLLAPIMRPWASAQLRRFMADFTRWAEAEPAVEREAVG